ncbi:MAG: FKBP-type peptidyl-prolyl cis-trans isomerase [Bacteroidia bacterium]|nr:FKBP-type peptidyl-prolyl cis-trans isomerase [Bacteroidia bacterium]
MKKLNMIRVVVALLLLVPVGVYSQGKKKKKTTVKENSAAGEFIKTASGLQYRFIAHGESPRVEEGDKCKVHYVLKTEKDSVMEDTRKSGTPWEFKANVSSAIPGFVEAVLLMGKGDRIEVIIPPNLGYKDQQAGAIPPHSTLKFEIELLETTPGLRPFNTKGKDTVKTASGLKYIIVQKGNSLAPMTGDIVTIHYSGYLPDGKMFDSSVERGETIKFNLGGSLPGLDEGIGNMTEGAKFRIILPYMLAFGEGGRGPIPPKTDVIYDVELVSVKKKVKPVAYDVVGKDTVTTSSGLKYIVAVKGDGTQGAQGKKVKVHYTGYLMDGSIFDSSVERDQFFEFTLGVNPVIQGWTEALQLMRIGDKWRLVIPPNLGYGANGAPPKIGPNATLIFDVELVGVE